MKATNRAVAQDFASGQQSSAQANNLYHSGRTIYSYGPHWPLAVKLDDKRVLLNQDRYSMTTSHHRSLVAGALIRAGWTIIDSTKAECQEAAVSRDARLEISVALS